MDEPILEDDADQRERPASEAPRSGSFARDLAEGIGAWARHTFSAASLLGGLKSLAWVAPLSVVIWIYAEREQTNSQTGFTIAVNIRSTDPTRVVRLLEPADGKIRSDISGPKGRLDQVREQLESGSNSVQLEVPEVVLSHPGRHEISTSLVNNVQPFVNNGLTLTNFAPRELSIYVDVLEDHEIEVVAPEAIKNLASPPVFEPAKLHVRLPHSVFELAQQNGMFYATANLKSNDLLTAGAHDFAAVPVSVKFGDSSVSLSPSVVSAHVEIKKSDISLTLPAVPVWVIYPPGMEDKYKAVYDSSLANVTVIGPEEQVHQMQSSDFKGVKATFEVGIDDLPVETTKSKPLQFQLPPGVRISPDETRRTISFHLSDRRAPE